MFTVLFEKPEPYLPVSMQRQQQAAKNLMRAHQLSRSDAEDVFHVISSAARQYPSSYLGKEHSLMHKIFIRTVDQLYKTALKAAEGFSPSVPSLLEPTGQLEGSATTQTIVRSAPHSLNASTTISRTVLIGTEGRFQKQLDIRNPFGASCSISQRHIPASASRVGILQPYIGKRTGALILTLATPLPPFSLAADDTTDGDIHLAKLLAGNMAGAIDAAISALDSPSDPAELRLAIQTASQPTWLRAYEDTVLQLRDTKVFDLASAASLTTAVWHESNLFVSQSGLNTLLLLSFQKVQVLAPPALRTNAKNLDALARRSLSPVLHNALRQAGSCSGVFYCAKEGDLEPTVETFPVARNDRKTLIFIDRPMPQSCSIEMLEDARLYKLSLVEIAQRVAEICISLGASRDLHVAAFHCPELSRGVV